MQKLVEKAGLVYTGNGYRLFNTDDEGVAWLEWERAEDCKLSLQLNKLVRAHALYTNFLDRITPCSMLVRKLEPIQLTVRVEATVNDTKIHFVNAQGKDVYRSDAESAPGAKPNRLDTMQDAALHLARSLRAHLMDNGVEQIALRLVFGVASGGACIMQVVNPADCDFGIADPEALYQALGGDQV